MNLNFNTREFQEKIRIKSDKITIEVLIASGKEDKQFVVVCPSLLVSGYGPTEQEAKESFFHNMEVFCKDILSIDTKERNAYLKSLGFVQETIKSKNFSKAYIDKNGVLQGFDPGTVKTEILEATC